MVSTPDTSNTLTNFIFFFLFLFAFYSVCVLVVICVNINPPYVAIKLILILLLMLSYITTTTTTTTTVTTTTTTTTDTTTPQFVEAISYNSSCLSNVSNLPMKKERSSFYEARRMRILKSSSSPAHNSLPIHVSSSSISLYGRVRRPHTRGRPPV